MAANSPDNHHPYLRAGPAWAALCGTCVGALGGLVGLGGAEFRLPLLIALFGFEALEAVIVNKAISLVVVASALVFRLGEVPLEALLANGMVIADLLVGSLLGAWCGASWAIQASKRALHRWMSVLLVGIAAALFLKHGLHVQGSASLDGEARWIVGAVTGFGIGAIASLLGVAGGELLIPTIVLLFGADIKLAGSLSLAVSLPTMAVGFARYSRDGSFQVLQRQRGTVMAMACGSLCGVAFGAALLGAVSADALLPLLAVMLIASAWKIWNHG